MSLQSSHATLEYFREVARELLNEFDAADGLACYYTLQHDPARTTIILHRASDGPVDGFLTHCITGIDLFRPLLTMRLRGSAAAANLLREGLVPGRPYLLIAPERVFEAAQPHLDIAHGERHRILRLDPARYDPETNVLIQHSRDRAGSPRVEVKRNNQPIASAGVNWRSAHFAEVYVQVEPGQERRGLGRSLVNALSGELIKLGLTAIYSVAESNGASLALAEQVGFVDTGAREVVATVSRA